MLSYGLAYGLYNSLVFKASSACFTGRNIVIIACKTWFHFFLTCINGINILLSQTYEILLTQMTQYTLNGSTKPSKTCLTGETETSYRVKTKYDLLKWERKKLKEANEPKTAEQKSRASKESTGFGLRKTYDLK